MVGTINPPTPTAPPHPYFPRGLALAGFVANGQPVWFLLAVLAAGIAAILAATYGVVCARNPGLAAGRDGVTLLWFVMCGCIHVFFEGYYVVNAQRMGQMTDLFGQLWKEYALSDSRYLAQNGLVWCVESITVTVWGPLSFLTAFLIATNSAFRHPLQMAVSIGHLYSDSLYFLTSTYDSYVLEIEHSRPEPVYFWGYYFGLNFLWIVVPIYLLYESVTTIARAFKALNASERALRVFQASNGDVIKASLKKNT